MKRRGRPRGTVRDRRLGVRSERLGVRSERLGVRSERLGVTDDMFWRSHQGMGLPLSMQGLWRFDATLTVADLEPAHRALTLGPLTRRVVRRRIWPARNAFAADAAVAPIHVEPEPLRPGTITAWADTRGDRHLDIDSGPVWELSLARLEGGGSVVSLVCSHVVADARALVAAAGLAASEKSAPARTPEMTAGPPTLVDDLRDATSQLRIVVSGVTRSLWKGCRDRGHRAELFAAAHHSGTGLVKSSGPPRWREPTAIFSVDSEDWTRAAAAHGGTSNTLFTSLVGELVLQIRGSGPVEIALPVARGGDEANSLTAAAIGIGSIDECQDLSSLRQRARDGYAEAGSGSGLGPPAGMPAELLQVIGPRAAHALVPDPGSRDGLASNLGELDGVLSLLAGHRGRAIAARSVHPGLLARETGATRTSVAAWAAESAGVMTISLAIPDPVVASSEDLHELINKALGHWDLTATHW
jgi:hypothetical protein